ncbi:MAG: hypothetical protein JJW03_05275, partial [Desulfosarcina sp.]|nr:hypothetical protein [Desulfobacterales bacterium]
VVAASNAHDRIKKQADYICDGTADQVEINAAILEAVGTPYTDVSTPVFLSGDFSINAPIRIRPGLTFDGGNLRQGTNITLANGSNCNIMYFDEVGQNASFITLKNFCANGNLTNQTSGNGIEFITDPMDVFMSNLWFTYCKETGIKQPFGWGNFYTNIIVEYCGSWGIEIGENAIITASKVIGNEGGGIKMSGSSNQIIGGIIGAGGDNTQAVFIEEASSNNIITGINTAIDAGTNRDGIVIAGDQNVVSNCISISTNARYQIWLQSTGQYNFISGNVARTASSDNIKVDQRVNFIHDNQQSVVPLWVTDDITIEDTRTSFSFVIKSPSSPAATKNVTLSTKIRINTKMEIFNYSGATTLMIDPTGLNHAVAPGEAAIFLKDSDSNWVLISSSAVTLDANADTLLSLTDQELGLDSIAANLIWGGPGSGANAVPTYRSLVDDDIPGTITLDNLSQITTKPITGLSATNWRLFYVADGGVPVELELGADGTYLRSNGATAAPTFATPSGTGDITSVLDTTSDAVDELIQAPTTLTVNSATPSIDGHTYFITANTSATTYTGFTGGVNGQKIEILVNDAFSTFAASLTGNSEAYLAVSGEKVSFTYSSTSSKWHFLGFPKTSKMTLVLSAANRAVVTNADSEIVVSDVTASELALLDGKTALASVGLVETITANWVNTANPWADNEVADDITLTDISQITGRKLDDMGTPDDNTDLNATTTYHGLCPKLPGGTTTYYRADGSFATPAGSGNGTMTTVKENDVGVGDADIVVIDFLGADFDLTESPDTEVQIVVAAAMMRDAEWTAATTTAAGKSELATTAEINTGTDTGRTATPDALAGSFFGTKEIAWTIIESDTVTAVADGKQFFSVPASWVGFELKDVTASVHDLNSAASGTTDIQIRRVRGATAVDMLTATTGLVTIAYDAYTASDGTVNTANDELALGDKIFVDVDAITTAAQKGLSVTAIFRLP